MAGIGEVKLSNRDLRENFKVAAMMLADANGVEVHKVNLDDLTQGFIRTPIDLTVGTALFQFPITTLDSLQGAPAIPIQNLVASVDAFVAGMMSYYVCFYNWLMGATQTTPDYGANNDPLPLTYPSPWTNNGTSLIFSQGAGFLWLGYLKIEVNSKVLYKNWDLLRHYNAPRTQASGAAPTYQALLRNQYDGGSDGFFPMEPLPVFSGSRQNVVQMFLPTNVSATGAAGTPIYPFALSNYGVNFVLKAVLHFRGINGQNCSGLK